MQPSVIFGREDRFLNLFAQLERWLPVMALACPNARFQPVAVNDVARAFAFALADDATHGQRYPLCGPDIYTLRQLVAYVGDSWACAASHTAGLPCQLQAAFWNGCRAVESRDNVLSMGKDRSRREFQRGRFYGDRARRVAPIMA